MTQIQSCVVCGKPMAPGAERYANMWEASLKNHPCCSEACADAYSQDEHWLPGSYPEPIEIDEEERLLEVAGERLRSGDQPRVIVRELLLAGLSALALRKLVNQASVATKRDEATARHVGVIGGLVGLLTGDFSLFVREEKEPDPFEAALEDLGRWEERFPQTKD